MVAPVKKRKVLKEVDRLQSDLREYFDALDKWNAGGCNMRDVALGYRRVQAQIEVVRGKLLAPPKEVFKQDRMPNELVG